MNANRRVARGTGQRWRKGGRERGDIQLHLGFVGGNPGKMLDRSRKRSGFSHGARGGSPRPSQCEIQAGGEAFLWSPSLSLIACCLLLSLSHSLTLPTTNQIRTPEMEFLAYSPPPPPRRNDKCPLSVIFTAPFGFAPPPQAIMSRPPLRRRRPPAAG